jgi:hypothetical protein
MRLCKRLLNKRLLTILVSGFTVVALASEAFAFHVATSHAATSSRHGRLTPGSPRWAIRRHPMQREKPSHGRKSLLGGRLRQQAQVSIAQVRAHW